MSELFAVTLAEQIAELTRELGYRRSVYPRWVAAGKLSATKAERQTEAMEAALATLRDVAREGRAE
jgi:hypothetical protein